MVQFREQETRFLEETGFLQTKLDHYVKAVTAPQEPLQRLQ